MRTRSTISMLAVVAIVILLAAVSISAQQKSSNSESAKKRETVNGRADFMKSSWGGKNVTLMKGNVTFTHGDTILTSDQVEYDESTKTAVSPGPFKISDPEADITGDKGSAHLKKKIGVVEGNVKMLVKPKKSGNNSENASKRDDFKEPTTITCDRLEYFYKDKIASAQGGVIFKQKNRTASADKAIYDQNKQVLTLIGNVKAKDENGEFSAPGKVIISLKEGDEWIEAENASTTFKIDLDEE